MLNVRSNYPSSYERNEKFCQVCCDKTQPDSQEHLFSCEYLVENNAHIQSEVTYSDIFNPDNFSKQIQASSILKRNYQRRQKILHKKYTNTEISQ